MHKIFTRIGSTLSQITNIITMLTASWVLGFSALFSLGTVLWTKSFEIANSPEVKIFVFYFLAILWTYIGLAVLIDRRKPKEVRVALDYAYGLTFENLSPVIQLLQHEAAFGFNISFRNNGIGPLKYRIEEFDIRYENRASPKLDHSSFIAIIPRGGGKSAGFVPFKRSDINDLIEKDFKGKIHISILYGHPDSKYERRLNMEFDFNVVLSELNNSSFGFNIISEKDMSF